MAPRVVKFPCGRCAKPVKCSDAGVFCEVCLYWFHCGCASISAEGYKKLQLAEGGWCCPDCERSALPFAECSRLSLGDDREKSVTLPSLNSTTTSLAAAPRVSGLFSIFYANSRSILPKMDELHFLVMSPTPPTIIALTETWLDSSITASEVSLPGYRLIRRDRSRQGGGVAFYISDSVVTKGTYHHPTAELLSVIVDSPVGQLLLAVVYRPPGLDSDLSELASAFHSLSLPNVAHAVVVGDFNVDLSTPHSTAALDLLAMIAGFGLHQTVQDHTRRAGRSSSLLDLVLCTDKALVSNISVDDPLGSSDHNSISVCLGFAKPKVLKGRRQIWLYQRADFDAINVALESSLCPVESIPAWSVDWAWSTIKSQFLSVMERYIPHRVVPTRRAQPPWITKDVRRCLHKREKARQAAKARDTADHWRFFRRLRNRAVSVVRLAKREFFSSLSVRVSNLKDFWKTYRSLTCNINSLPSTISNGVAMATTSTEKATMMNQFFASCFGPATLASTGSYAPPAGVATAGSATNTASTTDCGRGRELADLECSEMDVFRILSRLQVRKATGPDGISAVMLRRCAVSISGHLTALFNHSFSSGAVPSSWKVSRVTPIPKSDDSSLVSNYRPISLLSMVGKVQERLVHEVLMEHLLERGVLSDRQFGFRPSSSTQEALLSLTRGWHQVLDAGGSVLCVFLDLAKAFDSVPHQRIVECLHQAGVRAPLLAWFEDYLTGRRQFVAVEGVSSSEIAVTSGVPQGSILGPLLFLVAFNDIFEVPLSCGSSLEGYADDITFWKPIYCDGDISAANEDLGVLHSWIEDAGFRLQLKKTRCMLISRKRNPPTPRMFMGGKEIERVTSFKLLGVIVTDDLNWSSHISQVCVRSKRLLGCLYRTFNLASTSCLGFIYKAVVRPVLEYASCVWNPPHAVHREKLERVQSFGAKVVTKRWSESSTALRSYLHWPVLQARRDFQQLCVCNRILSGNSLIPSSVFQPHPRPSRVHSNTKPLFRQRVRTAQHSSSFFHRIIPIWNCLPDRVVSCGTQMGFKRTLRSHLFN